MSHFTDLGNFFKGKKEIIIVIVYYCILIAVLDLICMHQILDTKHVEVISSDSWLQIAPQYELIPDHSDQSDQK